MTKPTMSDDIVEVMARAIFLLENPYGYGWDEVRDTYFGTARAVQDALLQAGYVVAPKVPTEAMIDAYCDNGDAKRAMDAVCLERWDAMLAASEVSSMAAPAVRSSEGAKSPTNTGISHPQAKFESEK